MNENSYLQMLNETKVLSPFDEALERQKQPLLSTQTNYLQTNTSSSQSTIKMLRSSLTNLLSKFSLMGDHRSSVSPHLPLWSTKYRETNDPTVTETFMIETIDYMVPSHSDYSTKPTIGISTEEHYEDIIYVYDGMTMSNWYQMKQQQRARTQMILTILGLIVIIIIGGHFIFV